MTPRIAALAKGTVWIVETEDGFDALSGATGQVIASHKHKSSLEYGIRRDAHLTGIIAIAPVVLPSKRQPNRRLRTKHTRSYP